MKKKKNNFDYNYIIIIIFCICLIALCLRKDLIFGSRVDWLSQHTVFPDYFRKLFYATKNFFPSFAFQIGAGQNIYNFSYYGLYNPLIMLSFFLPMISMKTYIISLNIFLYIIFGLLLYYFLKTKNTSKISMISTLIILMSSTILFHFHRHFMFVNYLPFLVLALISVDRFYNYNKKSLLSFSIFMIITSSYYYSICSIIVIYIYFLYKYIDINKKIVIKELLKKVIAFSIPIIISILSSAILLLPTLFAIKSGRETITNSVSIINKLLPFINLKAVLYDNYSIGLTFISLLALIMGLFSKEKKIKILSLIIIILFNFPLFIYLLNGNLYPRNKVLIPFIPLFSLLIANLLTNLTTKKIKLKKIFIVSIIITILSLLTKLNYYALYLDIFIIILIIVLYYKKHLKESNLYIIILLISMTNFLISNYNDIYLTKDKLQEINNTNINNEIKTVLSKEKDIVRSNNLNNTLENINYIYDINYNQTSIYSSIYNKLYKDFYVNVFKNAISYRNNLMLSQNNDILFQSFMGVKYIYTNKNVPIGYKKISKNVYQNNNVFPVLYGTTKLINEEDFNKLKYPNTIEYLFQGAVVKNNKTNIKTNNFIKEETIDYKIKSSKNLKKKNKSTYLEIKALDNNSSLLLDTEDIKDKVLIIEFDIIKRNECKDGDLSISINSIKNTLTCQEWMYKNDNKTFHYVISGKDQDKLNIKFKRGVYKIDNIKTYLFNYDQINNYQKDLLKFNVEKNSNDKIIGNINMPSNGYFITSIPYDEGFKIKVDKKEVKAEIVNKAHLGFKLNKGNHQIEIKYNAPYQRQSLIITIIGIASFVILIYFDINKKYIKEVNTK